MIILYFIYDINIHTTPNNNISQINITSNKKTLFNHVKQQNKVARERVGGAAGG
jgi:hypothetical protein